MGTWCEGKKVHEKRGEVGVDRVVWRACGIPRVTRGGTL
jgi:hypothetical protein